MDIVFLGSSLLSCRFLEELKNSRHNIVAAVTKTEKKTGRGKKLLPNPMKVKASELKIKCIETTDAGSSLIKLLSPFSFEAIVVVSFGFIISQEIIDLVNGRALNMHPSILPLYRGPSPINSAILNGDDKTAVSIMQMTKELDAGNLYCQAVFKINDYDNKDILEKKVIEIGAPLLIGILNLLEIENIDAYPQKGIATYTKIFHSTDTQIDWLSDRKHIINKVRAFSYEPGAFTYFRGFRIKILSVSAHDALLDEEKRIAGDDKYLPGAIIRADKAGELLIKCADSLALKIHELKIQGKNRISAIDFINGYRPATGELFSSK